MKRTTRNEPESGRVFCHVVALGSLDAPRIICWMVGLLWLMLQTTTAFILPPARRGPFTTTANTMALRASSMFGPPSEPLVAVFSDVDGTLVHYPRGNDKVLLENHQLEIGKSNRILKLPPSATGMQGVISSQTLANCQELRSTGTKLVLVSGMRTSTLLTRLPFLPVADAYCNEGGGRIFFRIPLSKRKEQDWPAFVVHPVSYSGATEDDIQPFTLKEDLVWRQQMEQKEAAGTDGYVGVELPSSSQLEEDSNEAIPVSDRIGALWDFARQLSAQGLVLDTSGYATCFRVNRKQQTTTTSKEKFEQLLAGNVTCPPGISTSTNLGCVDFYPEESGKKNCCNYLAQKFDRDGLKNALSKHCVCLCDDDNDSEMALACEHAFIPGVGSASMKEIIKKQPTHFSRTGEDNQTLTEGLVATERALELILERAIDCGSRSIDGDECLLRIDDAREALKYY